MIHIRFTRIHFLQKIALRLIIKVPKLTGPLFHQCWIMPIQTRVTFYMVTTVYKCLNWLTPDYMKDMLIKSLMSLKDPHVWVPSKTYTYSKENCVSMRVLHYNGATLYNNLDFNTQSCHTLAIFKHGSFKHYYVPRGRWYFTKYFVGGSSTWWKK